MIIRKLNRILEYLQTNDKGVDNEDIAWEPDKYPFTMEEFREVFGYLEKLADDKIQSGYADIFPEHLAYFNYQDTKFIWRLLIGQGSSSQLLPENNMAKIEYRAEFEVIL